MPPQFEIDVVAALARIETFVITKSSEHERRLDDLEQNVGGNGRPGLSERMATQEAGAARRYGAAGFAGVLASGLFQVVLAIWRVYA